MSEIIHCPVVASPCLREVGACAAACALGIDRLLASDTNVQASAGERSANITPVPDTVFYEMIGRITTQYRTQTE